MKDLRRKDHRQLIVNPLGGWMDGRMNEGYTSGISSITLTLFSRNFVPNPIPIGRSNRPVNRLS